MYFFGVIVRYKTDIGQYPQKSKKVKNPKNYPSTHGWNHTFNPSRPLFFFLFFYFPLPGSWTHRTFYGITQFQRNNIGHFRLVMLIEWLASDTVNIIYLVKCEKNWLRSNDTEEEKKKKNNRNFLVKKRLKKKRFPSHDKKLGLDRLNILKIVIRTLKY